MMFAACDRNESAVAQVTPASEVKATAAAAMAPVTAPPANETAPAKPQPVPPAAPAPVQTPPPAAPTPSLSAAAPPGTVAPVKVPIDPAAYIVKVEPAELNFGDIPTNDTGKGKVTLTNTGDQPMTVVSARPSCGCTALKFTPNTVIQPKEAIDIELQMNGGAMPGPLHGKTVTFVVEGQPELVVPLKAMAVSFVTMEPATIDPEAMPEGKFTLKSKDGQAFKIMSAQPPVLKDLSEEPKAEHEVSIDFAKYREIGINRRLVAYLDHPKCQQVHVNVQFKPEELAKAAAEAQGKMALNKQALTDGHNTITPQQPAPAPTDPDSMLVNLIKQGNNAEVMQKLQTGLDVNYRDSAGTSLLSLAAKYGNTDLVQALMETKKIDINGTDNAGRTPLMHAATSKNVEAVRVLLDAGANPSTRDILGGTALSWAAGLGDSASVNELIDAGADVEVVGSVTGWTPLIWAAGFGDPASIEPLVKAHANLEAEDHLEGATPLIHASRTGKADGIKALIKLGANKETADKNGNTPFLACAKTSGGDAEKIQALIDAGVNIRAKDNRGLNALQLARKRTDIRAPGVIAILEPLLGAETPVEAAVAPPVVPAPAQPASDDHAGHDHSDPNHKHDQ